MAEYLVTHLGFDSVLDLVTLTEWMLARHLGFDSVLDLVTLTEMRLARHLAEWLMDLWRP